MILNRLNAFTFLNSSIRSQYLVVIKQEKQYKPLFDVDLTDVTTSLP